MLKEIFESTFFHTFPRKNNSLLCLNEFVYQGDFYLADETSCKQCDRCLHHLDNRKNLRISSDLEVYALNLNSVYEQIKEYFQENCDFIIADRSKVLLVEMTCSQSNYINNENSGKLVKARRQLYNTLVTLRTNPDTKAFIEKREGKHVVFSYKETDALSDRDDERESGFLAFTDFSDEVHSPDNIQKFDFDFDFREIRFPTQLNWNTL